MQISTETGYTFKWTMLTVPEEKIKREIISFCAGLRVKHCKLICKVQRGFILVLYFRIQNQEKKFLVL